MTDGFLAAGLLYSAALFAGRVFSKFHFPKVTGYLLSGLVLGPSLSEILGISPVLSNKALHSLDFLSLLGIALIMFSVGSNFRVTKLKKYGTNLIKASLIESGFTFLLVFMISTFFRFGTVPSLFLGIMAMNTAPGATQMVMRELQSEGELSELTLILIGLNNLMGILLFVILFYFFGGKGTSATDSIIWKLSGPVAGGVGVGLVISYWEQRLTKEIERQIMAVSMILLLIWGSIYFSYNLLFAALVAGMTVINFSPHEKRLFSDVSKIDYPIYVIFFALAGTHLKLQSLPSMGLVGIGYVFMRTIGKYYGNRAGAAAGGFSTTIKENLGSAMLCQAGIAIGLAQILANTWGDNGGLQLQNVILASVVVFEVVGPVMTRIALVKAGEVTVVSMLTSRAPVGIFEGVHDLFNHFASNIGFSMSDRFSSVGDIPIKMVMRRHVETIPEDMDFDSLLKTMGHSRYDRLPVIDSHDNLVGIIHYSDISNVLFIEELRQLVVARDISVPIIAELAEDDSLEKAMDVFHSHPNISYLFIVSSKDRKKLAGVLRHNDALSAHGGV